MPTRNTFVPKGYEPKSGNSDFFKFEAGDNKFRILTDAVIGKVGWKDNKPFRRSGEDAVIEADEVDVDAKTKRPKINEFMAFMVYSYDHEKVMLAEITQAGIKKAIVEFAQDEEWGHPSGYDITVNRKGEGFSSKYTVKPSPAKPLAKDIQKTVDAESEFFDIEKALNLDAE